MAPFMMSMESRVRQKMLDRGVKVPEHANLANIHANTAKQADNQEDTE